MGEIIEQFGRTIVAIIAVIGVLFLFFTFWSRSDIVVYDNGLVDARGHNAFTQKILQAVNDAAGKHEHFENGTADIGVENYKEYDLYVHGASGLVTERAYREQSQVNNVDGSGSTTVPSLLVLEAYEIDPVTNTRTPAANVSDCFSDVQVIGIYDTYNNALVASTTNTVSACKNYNNCVLCGNTSNSSANSSVDGKYPVKYGTFHGYSRVPIKDTDGNVIDYKTSHMSFEPILLDGKVVDGEFIFFTPGDYVLKVQAVDKNGKSHNSFVRVAVNSNKNASGIESASGLNVDTIPGSASLAQDYSTATITLLNIPPSIRLAGNITISDTLGNVGTYVPVEAYDYMIYKDEYKAIIVFHHDYLVDIGPGTYYVTFTLPNGSSVVGSFSVS